MPSETFSRTVEIPADQEAVWARLQVPETWTGLGPVREVSDPEWDDAGVLTGFSFQAEAGPQRIQGRARTRVAERPERLVIDFDARGFTGELAAALSKNGGGTLVDVSLGIGTTDFLMSLVFGVVAGVIRKDFPDQVDGLARHIAAEA